MTARAQRQHGMFIFFDNDEQECMSLFKSVCLKHSGVSNQMLQASEGPVGLQCEYLKISNQSILKMLVYST